MDANKLNVFADNIAVVLVLYKTNFYTCPAFVSISQSAKMRGIENMLDYFVFDNSPEPTFNDKVRMQKDGIKFKYDSTNPGLSKPSNDGAALAREHGKKWILFTNPDTTYPLDYFEVLYTTLMQNTEVEMFAPVLISNSDIVSPARYNFFIGSSPENVTFGINFLRKKLVLYSGMFVTLEAFFNCGGFNDKIKLDFMDCYFSENYRKHYSRFYLLNATCQHDLSSYEKNIEKVLNRFRYYCEGAKYFASSKINSVFLFFICILRSIKLGIKFRSYRFLKAVFSVFFSRQPII